MRVFVAVEVFDESVLKEIRKIQDGLKINARRVDTQMMHLTLLFLGEVGDQAITDVKKALGSIMFEPFRLSFGGIGAFPGARRPRTIWAGIDGGADELGNLASKVESALIPLGFKNDKPFRPHMTIFRIKSKTKDITEDLKKIQDVRFDCQDVTRFKLKKSILTQQGPVYSDLLEVMAS